MPDAPGAEAVEDEALELEEAAEAGKRDKAEAAVEAGERAEAEAAAAETDGSAEPDEPRMEPIFTGAHGSAPGLPAASAATQPPTASPPHRAYCRA